MAANFVQLCRRAGVEPEKPLAESSRRGLFSELGCKIPKEVTAFYQACNGSGSRPHRIRRDSPRPSKFRFYPLAEAVEMAGAWDFLVSFHLIPFFESASNTSDPCMVGLDGPLAGYVFQICHDGPSRVHAPSIAEFLRGLGGKKPEELREIDRASFTYPKKLTAADKTTVKKLIDRSKKELDEEPSLLVTLAMSMLTDAEFVGVMGGLKHPDPSVQHEITSRLKRINAPAAKRVLKGLEMPEKDLKAFVKEAVKRLKKAGMPVKTDAAGTSLELVDDSINLEISYDVKALYEGRKSKDFWDWLINDARSYVVGDEDEEGAEEPPKPARQIPKPMRPTLKLYEEVTRKLSWWGCNFCDDEELTEHPTLGDISTADRTTAQKYKHWNVEMGRFAMQQGWLVVPTEGPLKFLVMGPVCAAKHYGKKTSRK